MNTRGCRDHAARRVSDTTLHQCTRDANAIAKDEDRFKTMPSVKLPSNAQGMAAAHQDCGLPRVSRQLLLQRQLLLWPGRRPT
jgi:hypothetical protein